MQSKIKSNDEDQKQKQDNLEIIVETMIESQNQYKMVIDAAETSGVYKRQSLKNKANHSSQYFKGFIKPQNDWLQSQRDKAEQHKLETFVVLDDLVKSKANIKARVKYYMDVLPDEKSLAA